MKKEYYAEYRQREDKYWWFQGRREIFLSLLEQYLPPASEPRQILDVGCGTGTMLGHLRRFGQAQGVDMDPDAVNFTRERGEKASLALGHELPFADASFDLVTALDVIEHIEDVGPALSEIRRVLKDDGIFLCSVPAFMFLWGRQDVISMHHRRYRRGQLRATLEEAGFAPIRSTYFNTLLFPPIAAIRLLRRLVPEPEAPRSDFGTLAFPAANAPLSRAFGMERRVLRFFDLPFGVSILAIARKAEASLGRVTPLTA